MSTRRNVSSRRLVGLWPALVVGLAACNHTPVEDIQNSFTLKVEVGTGDENRVKIDFLWVIDNSTSMCQEQAALARSFDTFVETLEQGFDVDAQIAVTSVVPDCENDGNTIFAGQGRFNQHAGREVSLTCGESVRMPCDGQTCPSGLDCSELGHCDTNGAWACSDQQLAICSENPNGSINEYCTRSCSTDEECRQVFGDPTLRCTGDPGSVRSSACVREPPTADCPDTLPAILKKNDEVDDTALFPCIATVGLAPRLECFRYEQQLRGAFMAIDPAVNPDQHAAFVRPDAYLVVIIISDEEDCSIEPKNQHLLNESEGGSTVFDRCGLKPSTDDGGPLIPVAHFVNRFKALKNDPGKVIVATIAGDSLAENEADANAARDAYLSSKDEPQDCRAQTYICESEAGIADYGRRLREFSDAFGPNGKFENICKGEIDSALTSIAEAIVDVVNHVCLPKPVLTGLTVTRIRDGAETVLLEGTGPNTYTRLTGAEDCAVNGIIMPAISPNDRPQPGDELRIVYQGDPQLQ